MTTQESFSKFSPTWDHEQFFQICGNDKELAEELITLYNQQFDQSFTKLTTAVETKDQPTAILYAHDIKGASANLGCQDVSSHSLTLEQLAKAGKIEEMKGLLGGLDGAQKEAMRILGEVLDDFPEEDEESEYESEDEESEYESEEETSEEEEEE